MGLAALASVGIVLPSAPVDLDTLPWRIVASEPVDLMAPGVYVVAEPIGDAPWAGTLCTNWRHVAGMSAWPCPFCGIRSA